MTDVIRDLPIDDRPRERMMAHGAETLSDAELFAIILGCGTQGKNAIQLAREILHEGITKLRDRDIATLADVPGMGMAKATRVHAALEIAHRIASGRPEEPPPLHIESLGQKLVGTLGRQTQERLGAVFLDARHRVVKQRNDIYVGTINNALVSTRDIIRYALNDGATGLVVYHNHPSGTATPSTEDRTFTTKLRDSLALVDVDLVDHLIIGAFGFASMRNCGFL